MKTRKGLTLIEVILSIALLTLIAVIFLGMFNMGNKFIFDAGSKTKSVVKSKEEIDIKIREAEEAEKNSDESKKIKIIIPGINGDNPMEVEGVIINSSDSDDPENPNIKITTFVPNKKVNP